MAVHKFGTRTPTKRVPHAHAGNENESGNLSFLNAHKGGAVDCDVQPAKGPLPGTAFAHDGWTQFCEHWPKPKRAGYTHLGNRPLTRAELNKPINRWRAVDWAKLRGPGGRPVTLDAYVAHARKVNCQPLFEFKNANNVARPAVAARVVAICKAHNVALMPMVLADRQNVTGMIQAFARHGIVTAVIGGKHAQKIRNKLYLRVRATKLRPYIVRW